VLQSPPPPQSRLSSLPPLNSVAGWQDTHEITFLAPIAKASHVPSCIVNSRTVKVNSIRHMANRLFLASHLERLIASLAKFKPRREPNEAPASRPWILNSKTRSHVLAYHFPIQTPTRALLVLSTVPEHRLRPRGVPPVYCPQRCCSGVRITDSRRPIDDAWGGGGEPLIAKVS
jgi:hypothetical protein